LQLIVAKYVCVPAGTLLEIVPDFASNLIEHIDGLAFKWALVQLFIEWSARLPNWRLVIAILTIVVSRGRDAGYGVLVVTRKAFLSDSPALRNRSELPVLARAVLAFCLLDSSVPVQRTDSHVLAELLRERRDAADFAALLAEYVPRQHFEVGGMVGLAIFHAFPCEFERAVSTFLRDAANFVSGTGGSIRLRQPGPGRTGSGRS
jgi:hypothetical protein